MNQNEYQNLLALLKITGGKYILVEDGQPKAVLMSYEEFSDLAVPRIAGELANRVEQINQEITHAQVLDLREEVIAEPDLPVAAEITVEPLDLL
ncbi:MAG: hypothetical protein HY398_00215 [Candidatus Doudnabacteria bacterium]|nr:hypothetical protein [Candidatus Doudnabacteria bacterium]